MHVLPLICILNHLKSATCGKNVRVTIPLNDGDYYKESGYPTCGSRSRGNPQWREGCPTFENGCGFHCGTLESGFGSLLWQNNLTRRVYCFARGVFWSKFFLFHFIWDKCNMIKHFAFRVTMHQLPHPMVIFLGPTGTNALFNNVMNETRPNPLSKNTRTRKLGAGFRMI